MPENQNDILEQLEKTVKDLHDKNEKLSRPLIRKYPLLFAFVFTFSFAAILHGFELTVQNISFIQNNPYILIISGSILLFTSGALYKNLNGK